MYDEEQFKYYDIAGFMLFSTFYLDLKLVKGLWCFIKKALGGREGLTLHENAKQTFYQKATSQKRDFYWTPFANFSFCK